MKIFYFWMLFSWGSNFRADSMLSFGVCETWSWTNHGYLEKVPGKSEKQFWNVSADDARDSTNSGSQLSSGAHHIIVQVFENQTRPKVWIVWDPQHVHVFLLSFGRSQLFEGLKIILSPTSLSKMEIMFITELGCITTMSNMSDMFHLWRPDRVYLRWKVTSVERSKVMWLRTFGDRRREGENLFSASFDADEICPTCCGY